VLQRVLVTGSLKRTQKGSEGEWTGMVYPAVNGIELRKNGFLLDPAQGLCMLEGNISQRVIGERSEKTRSPRPTRAIHCVIKVTSETLLLESS
jgi:hypothetical protein